VAAVGSALAQVPGQPLTSKISQGVLVCLKVISSLSIRLIIDARMVIFVVIEQGSAPNKHRRKKC
jgi:hypothetical protein